GATQAEHPVLQALDHARVDAWGRLDHERGTRIRRMGDEEQHELNLASPSPEGRWTLGLTPPQTWARWETPSTLFSSCNPAFFPRTSPQPPSTPAPPFHSFPPALSHSPFSTTFPQLSGPRGCPLSRCDTLR